MRRIFASITRSRLREPAVSLAALVLVAGALHGQVRTEAQVFGVATSAADPFIGGGVGYGVRSAGRLRLLVSAAVGAVNRSVAGRGELVVTFSLNPVRRRGVVPYAGGGMAAVALRDDVREYVVLLLGVESRPGARTGWFAEVGVGGGVRGVVGVRLRWTRSRGRRRA